MSSTDLKPESKSENNQAPSKLKGVRGLLHVFMKEIVVKNHHQPFPRENSLYTILFASSSHAKIVLIVALYVALENARAEVMLREIDAFLHAKPKDRDEMFTKFMTRGGCKEAFMAWTDFCKEARKNNNSCLHTPPMDTMLKCVKAHSDYYHPLLTVFKTAEEHFKKEIEALNTREQPEADAKR
ncbi:unnamed protein product [Arabidopsis halleri]